MACLLQVRAPSLSLRAKRSNLALARLAPWGLLRRARNDGLCLSVRLARRMGAFKAGGVADHSEAEARRVVEATGHRARLVEGYALDQRGAAVEVIDAELVGLHLHQHPGDAPGRIEA